MTARHARRSRGRPLAPTGSGRSALREPADAAGSRRSRQHHRRSRSNWIPCSAANPVIDNELAYHASTTAAASLVRQRRRRSACSNLVNPMEHLRNRKDRGAGWGGEPGLGRALTAQRTVVSARRRLAHRDDGDRSHLLGGDQDPCTVRIWVTTWRENGAVVSLPQTLILPRALRTLPSSRPATARRRATPSARLGRPADAPAASAPSAHPARARRR